MQGAWNASYFNYLPEGKYRLCADHTKLRRRFGKRGRKGRAGLSKILDLAFIYRSIYEIQMNSDDRELLEQAESFPLKGGVENGL